MKKVILMGFVLLITMLVSAQQDKKAKEILDQVSENTRSYSTISVDFAISLQNKDAGVDENFEGSIKLKGQKYIVESSDFAGGIKVFSDGETIWNYMVNGNQVTISIIDEEGGDLMDPSALFSIYEKGFESKFIGEENVEGKLIYKIDLFPDSDEYGVEKISVSINKSTMMIQSATLHGTDDNLYLIEVKKMETNNSFLDSDFVFNAKKFPNVDIIDFR